MFMDKMSVNLILWAMFRSKEDQIKAANDLDQPVTITKAQYQDGEEAIYFLDRLVEAGVDDVPIFQTTFVEVFGEDGLKGMKSPGSIPINPPDYSKITQNTLN